MTIDDCMQPTQMKTNNLSKLTRQRPSALKVSINAHICMYICMYDICKVALRAGSLRLRMHSVICILCF